VRHLGAAGHGRWIRLGKDCWRKRHYGSRRMWQRAVFFRAGLIPAIRTLISVPAGLVRMPWLVHFSLLEYCGSLLWTSVWTLSAICCMAEV